MTEISEDGGSGLFKRFAGFCRQMQADPKISDFSEQFGQFSQTPQTQYSTFTFITPNIAKLSNISTLNL